MLGACTDYDPSSGRVLLSVLGEGTPFSRLIRCNFDGAGLSHHQKGAFRSTS